MFPDLRKLPYEQRLSHLCLWSLEERCNRTDLIVVFKMIRGISATPWSFLQPSIRQHNQRSQLETEKETLSYRYSISLLLTDCQPLELSQRDIDATMLNSFRSWLERRRNHEMDFFKDEQSSKSYWLHDLFTSVKTGTGYARCSRTRLVTR